MTREEAQYRLEHALANIPMDDEDRDVLFQAIYALADPDTN